MIRVQGRCRAVARPSGRLRRQILSTASRSLGRRRTPGGAALAASFGFGASETVPHVTDIYRERDRALAMNDPATLESLFTPPKPRGDSSRGASPPLPCATRANIDPIEPTTRLALCHHAIVEKAWPAHVLATYPGVQNVQRDLCSVLGLSRSELRGMSLRGRPLRLALSPQTNSSGGCSPLSGACAGAIRARRADPAADVCACPPPGR